MTADIRTAAQRVSEARWPRQDISLLHDADMENHLIRTGFTEGAVWGAARVTPTRESVMAAIDEHGANDQTELGQAADEVLSLMAGLAEGES